MIAWLIEHPNAVAAVVIAALVHLRAVLPAAKEGSAYGLVLKVWDIIAGNYGAAKNAEKKD